MTLGEILAARAENARAREVVEIGSLGSIALEALPIQDLERLSRGADADRAVFYAASRELQSVGAALLRAGKVSRPDQVMAFVSDDEAAKAASAVRALSGWSGAAREPESPADLVQAEKSAAQDDVPEPSADSERARIGQDSHETEIRLDGVQKNEVRHEIVQENDGADEVRLELVRTEMTDFEEIRPASVQLEMERGQVSHEFLAENGGTTAVLRKPQVLRGKMPDAPQNVGISDSSDGGLQNPIAESSTGSGETSGAEMPPVHETESESGAEKGEALHETESEIRESVHEIRSENRTAGAVWLHEIESESAEKMHETESELTERVARGILEGLRRAAWVR